MRKSVCVLARHKDGRWIGRENDGVEIAGGKIDGDEKPQFAAFREFVEETGIVPSSLRLILVTDHIVGDDVWHVNGYAAFGTTRDYPNNEVGHTLASFTEDDLTGSRAKYADVMNKMFVNARLLAPELFAEEQRLARSCAVTSYSYHCEHSVTGKTWADAFSRLGGVDKCDCEECTAKGFV